MEDGQLARVRDIRAYLAGLYGSLVSDEGLLYGHPDATVHKLMVCWMATVEALAFAVENHVDTIIAHEALYFPKDALSAGNVPEFMSWKVNLARVSLLDRGGIALLRCHGTLDKYCIFDDFAALLSLGDPIVREPNLVQIYDGAGRTFGDYLERVRSIFNLSHVRHTRTDPSRIISRVGLPWGGLGLSNNARYMQSLVDQQCDLFIAGELDNYGIRFAIDSGIAMIETGHEISENPGLRHFAQILASIFPAVDVIFYENKPVFD
jgi:putative NIF3 family GTP cyclohydrolase 1 type 2